MVIFHDHVSHYQRVLNRWRFFTLSGFCQSYAKTVGSKADVMCHEFWDFNEKVWNKGGCTLNDAPGSDFSAVVAFAQKDEENMSSTLSSTLSSLSHLNQYEGRDA